MQLDPKYDPAAKKSAVRKASDFAGLAEQYFEAKQKDLRPATWAEWRRIVKRDVLPRLGRFAPDEITRAEVKAFRRKIDPEDKRPVLANRCVELIRTIFNWALEEELVSNNPARGLKRLRAEKPRERTLSSDELRAVWEALGLERPYNAAVIKFIFYTATRRSEAFGARWTDIDFREKLWTIPTTKAGRKHVIPLSDAAVDILESMRPLSGHHEFIFVGLKGPLTTIQKSLGRIRENSGVDFTVHDCRRTAATMLGELDVRSEIISLILNHVPKGPAATRIYERSSKIPQMRDALERLAQHINRIVMDEPDSKILEFKQ
jgi:integrase